jgi:hypothetical protein
MHGFGPSTAGGGIIFSMNMGAIERRKLALPSAKDRPVLSLLQLEGQADFKLLLIQCYTYQLLIQFWQSMVGTMRAHAPAFVRLACISVIRLVFRRLERSGVCSDCVHDTFDCSVGRVCGAIAQHERRRRHGGLLLRNRSTVDLAVSLQSALNDAL